MCRNWCASLAHACTPLSFLDVFAMFLIIKIKQNKHTHTNTHTHTHANADLQRATMQAEIDSLKTQVFNLQSTPTLAASAATTPVTSPFTVHDVAHELKLRTSKKTNIIISGIPLTTILSDVQIVTNRLSIHLKV